MKYTCERCRYSTDLKTNMTTHLQRKNECAALLSQKSVSELLEAHLYRKPSSLQCDYCGNTYKYRQSKAAHMLKCPKKEKNVLERLDEQEHVIQELRSKIMELSQNKGTVVNNIVNNNNINTGNTLTTNTINNIELKSFGNESIDHIFQDIASLSRYFMTMPNGLMQVLEKRYFDKAHPENLTVRLPNKREPFLDVYDGPDRGWVTKKRDSVIDEMLNESKNMLDEHLAEHGEEMKKMSREVFERVLLFFNRFKDRLDTNTVDKFFKDLQKQAMAVVISNLRN